MPKVFVDSNNETVISGEKEKITDTPEEKEVIIEGECI